MAVKIHSPFKAPPSISRAGFITVLKRHGSFDADPLWEPTLPEKRPNEAARIYDYIASQGHDPARFLAIAGKEHTWGANTNSVLWRNRTHSWTNARNIRHPDVSGRIIRDEMRGSHYVKYASVYDSVRDGIYRIEDPDYAYADATSIAEVIAVWAPADDANDPEGYAQTMVRWINEWAKEFPVEEKHVSDIYGVPFRRFHIPHGNRNRPGGNYAKTVIVNHETGNSSTGANAEMHRQFTHNGGGVYNVSFHYTVDSVEIIELLPPWEIAWHGGDGADGRCNLHGVAIELCVNADGDWQKTLENGAKLNAWLLKEHGLTPPAVIWQHNNCSGKNCPTRLRASGWNNYVARISALYHDRPQEDKVNLPKNPDLDAAFHPDHGFAGYMRWLMDRVGKQEALLLVGYPITEEFKEDGTVVQYTERMRFEWHPGKRPYRYDVLLGRTGAELIEAQQRIKQLETEVAELRGSER